jgi:hypothetical protein
MSIFELRQFGYMLILVNTKGSTMEGLRPGLEGLSDYGPDRTPALSEDPWDGLE